MKPCLIFLLLDNNFLKQGFSATKQGFILPKHKSMKIKQYKKAVKRRFPPCEKVFHFEKAPFWRCEGAVLLN